MPEMGEYIVGAYLRIKLDCEFVVYNQKLSRRRGEFGEVDVLGIDTNNHIIYLCEVVTHIQGLLYGKGYEETKRRIKRKFISNIKYANNIFPGLNKIYMLWSPVVNVGKLTNYLKNLHGDLDLSNDEFVVIINKEYTEKIDQLRSLAKNDAKDRGEPFYRALQIIQHIK